MILKVHSLSLEYFVLEHIPGQECPNYKIFTNGSKITAALAVFINDTNIVGLFISNGIFTAELPVLLAINTTLSYKMLNQIVYSVLRLCKQQPA